MAPFEKLNTDCFYDAVHLLSDSGPDIAPKKFRDYLKKSLDKTTLDKYAGCKDTDKLSVWLKSHVSQYRESRTADQKKQKKGVGKGIKGKGKGQSANAPTTNNNNYTTTTTTPTTNAPPFTDYSISTTVVINIQGGFADDTVRTVRRVNETDIHADVQGYTLMGNEKPGNFSWDTSRQTGEGLR